MRVRASSQTGGCGCGEGAWDGESGFRERGHGHVGGLTNHGKTVSREVMMGLKSNRPYGVVGLVFRGLTLRAMAV